MLSPKIALVTGGAKRIGAAIVRDLASHGWAVAIHCNRSPGEAAELAGELSAGGAPATVVYGDLADPNAPARVAAQAAAALGPLTLLVNNASMFVKDEFGALELDLWQRQLDVNLRAPVFLAEAFAAQLPDGVEGNIVNIIDQRVVKLTPKMPSYTISKAALWAATQTMAQAFAPRIRVNGIGPGPTFPNSYSGDAGMTRQASRLPLERTVDPADIGRAVRFIVDTPSMTGQLLLLDSGQHIGWKTRDIID